MAAAERELELIEGAYSAPNEREKNVARYLILREATTA
jgi:hypothetical protein